MRRAAAPGFGVALAAALFAGTRDLDRVVSGAQLGPGFWPRLVLVGLALTCLAKFGEEFLRLGALARPGDGGVAPLPIARGRLAAAVGLIVLYVLGTEVLGFALATALFIVGFMWLCGARELLVLGASAVGGTVALLYLFVKFVYLPLPKGAWPFEGVTLAVYRSLHIF